MKRSTVNVSVTLSMNTTCIMGTFIVNNDAFIMTTLTHNAFSSIISTVIRHYRCDL